MVEGSKLELIAWCIALEGSVNLIRSGNALRPRIAFFNTEYTLVEQFNSLVGYGNIYTQRRNNNHHKELHYWKISSYKDCLNFCRDILPHLPTKVKQALLLIEFCELRLAKYDKRKVWKFLPLGEREYKIFYRMKRLNKRGL